MAERRAASGSSFRGGGAAAFLRSLLSDPLRTGAIAPSGRRLARAVAAEVDPSAQGCVIELGPGTGVFTRALLERGIAPQRLVLIEFNPEFCSLLATRFAGVRIIRGDAYEVARHAADAELGRPAAIVSGLPLLNRPMSDRAQLIAAALELGGPDMPFVQFSYGIGPPVPPGATWRVSPARRVWLNFPPAAVWVYRRPG